MMLAEMFRQIWISQNWWALAMPLTLILPGVVIWWASKAEQRERNRRTR